MTAAGFALLAFVAVALSGGRADLPRPGPVQNLTVVEAEATNITVKWLKPTGPGSATVTRYLVDFIASKSEGQTLEIPNNSSEVNVTLTGFQPYEGFMVEVQGCNLGSCGPIGRVNGKTAPIAPSPPRNLRVRIIDEFSIMAEWREPMHLNGELTGYKVWLRDSANRKDQIMDGLPTSQIIFNLDPSLKYHLEVVAYNVDRGNELRSEVVQLKFTTRPGFSLDYASFAFGIAFAVFVIGLVVCHLELCRRVTRKTYFPMDDEQ